jgi:hypothetical protein
VLRSKIETTLIFTPPLAARLGTPRKARHVGLGPAIEEPFDHVHCIELRLIGSTLFRE